MSPKHQIIAVSANNRTIRLVDLSKPIGEERSVNYLCGCQHNIPSIGINRLN